MANGICEVPGCGQETAVKRSDAKWCPEHRIGRKGLKAVGRRIPQADNETSEVFGSYDQKEALAELRRRVKADREAGIKLG